jgi:hypothetical protein
LHETDYPAHFDVAYPETLSRKLALVKWWLLAISHYLIVAAFGGGGVYGMHFGGAIAAVVLVGVVALLFTGRYPKGLFDLALGMNRWALRVAAYASLMTDEYPPFRLDQGGIDPDSVPAHPTPPPPSGMPATAPYTPPPPASAPAGTATTWTTAGTGAGTHADR